MYHILVADTLLIILSINYHVNLHKNYSKNCNTQSIFPMMHAFTMFIKFHEETNVLSPHKTADRSKDFGGLS